MEHERRVNGCNSDMPQHQTNYACLGSVRSMQIGAKQHHVYTQDGARRKGNTLPMWLREELAPLRVENRPSVNYVSDRVDSVIPNIMNKKKFAFSPVLPKNICALIFFHIPAPVTNSYKIYVKTTCWRVFAELGRTK